MERQRQPPPPPDIDGYLSKLKSKASMFGSWTKRYFRVNKEENSLEYFSSKSASSGKPSGSMLLENLTSIKKFDGFSFEIQAVGEVYFLTAESAAEQTCWIRALESYLQERRDYDTWLVTQKAYNRETERNDKK